MRTSLGVLSSMLMLECGLPDARAGSIEGERSAPRLTLARMAAPGLGGAVPPPFDLIDCNRERRQDCIRFCVAQYSPASSLRCIRACNQYCRKCPADRLRACIH